MSAQVMRKSSGREKAQKEVYALVTMSSDNEQVMLNGKEENARK